MKDSEKNRDPRKAYQRAKNDGATAVRKLTAWAEELGFSQAARDLAVIGEDLAEVAAELEAKQKEVVGSPLTPAEVSTNSPDTVERLRRGRPS